MTDRNFGNHIFKKHIDIFHDKYHLLQNVWHPGLLVRIKIKLGVPYYTLYAKVIFDYKKFHIHTILKFKLFHLKINLAQSDYRACCHDEVKQVALHRLKGKEVYIFCIKNFKKYSGAKNVMVCCNLFSWIFNSWYWIWINLGARSRKPHNLQ